MTSDPVPSADLLRQIDSLCDRFESAWSAERRPLIESYLPQMPEDARPALLRELLELEFACRRRVGETPDLEEYRRRFVYLGEWVGPLVEELFRPPAGRFRVTLAVTEGPHRGAVYSFAEHDTFLVGRAPSAHFSLPDDPYFSRMHFLVEVNPPRCRLLDLNSRNKTFVNGQAAETVELADGDEIRAGRTVLQVRIEGPAAPAGGQQPGTGLAETRPLPPGVAGADQMPANARPTVTQSPQMQARAAQLSRKQGVQVPGYEMVRELGHGGMGEVWLARREADGGRVAIKTIRPAAAPEPELVERFLREASILQRLRHPHIVAFHEPGEAAGCSSSWTTWTAPTPGSC
jgi:hypothetical protein